MKTISENSEFLIRAACAEDFPGIQSLLESLKLPLEGVEEHLADFLILSQEGKIIGTVGLEIYRNRALLRSLAVTEEHQGKGIGTLLYRTVIEKARNSAISEIYLLTETAEHFFSAMGFEKINRDAVDERIKGSVEFQSVCPVSAACMRLKLN